jgi:glucose/arabinose dehydrogenase
VTGLPPVDARGQGGLLDVALDPDFATNSTIYWSFAEPQDGGTNNTAVARGRFVDGASPRVEDVRVIYHQVPAMASRAHFGSRLVFARDKTLLVTQGDRSFTPGRMISQNKDVLVGKFVRLDSVRQSVRQPAGRSSRDLVHRSPQCAGGGAASVDRRAVGR